MRNAAICLHVAFLGFTSETRTNIKKRRSKAFFVLAQWPVSYMGDDVTGDKKTFIN